MLNEIVKENFNFGAGTIFTYQTSFPKTNDSEVWFGFIFKKKSSRPSKEQDKASNQKIKISHSNHFLT
jgi:hypothetical protein